MFEFIQQHYEILVFFILGLFLAISSFIDAWKREIPIFLCIPTILLITAVRYISKVNITEHITVALVLGLLYLCQAMLFTGSGGDVLLMMVVGYGMGMTGSLFAIVFSVIPLLIYAIVYKILHKNESLMKISYPLAPCITIGCAVFFLLEQSNIINLDLWGILTNSIGR